MGCECEGYHKGPCTCEEGAKPSVASDGYARPRTRGELRDLLNSGVACEVAEYTVPLTRMLLHGWLDCKCTVRPSENEGWAVFERA